MENHVNILVVEDSPVQALKLKNDLKKNSYHVTVTGSGEEALTYLYNNKPNVIISDIVMPGIDGYQLCRQIKSDEILKNIPVILLTQLSDPKDVIRGLKCGADNFLTKPYNESFLISRIKSVLNNRMNKGNGNASYIAAS
ncbi:response regulator [Pelotomaculum isophthalicicum JI]|uniref:Stage 0 sporulation protein A homolog n=1 Tax=Pelotomaculum isophthalicicum JI TaxID=947010 RepID=A0A9X4JV91_9FIRM|nr:response regulator [Pelotomaculum isophthalicicum]MDF9407886.1 response regulator [Pelotomaculum isophthalicicum JI]